LGNLAVFAADRQDADGEGLDSFEIPCIAFCFRIVENCHAAVPHNFSIWENKNHIAKFKI
jgi:hypothetical protein